MIIEWVNYYVLTKMSVCKKIKSPFLFWRIFIERYVDINEIKIGERYGKWKCVGIKFRLCYDRS